ncbi:unnamed protein product [Ranitomeya imitator]|uniref:Uncharacterized protein n=1 Tax=Ranitomeya imitator TaxID=111125 RepID=A0ABN9LQ86_9NEOB|nr:unnamed protein product [Ranitomeya imitator]
METKENISTQHLENPLSVFCDVNEGDESLKVEMIPLKGANIQLESTKVTIISDQPPVRDHVIWSILNFFYMNFCCLGLIALIFSVKPLTFLDCESWKNQNNCQWIYGKR